MKRDRGVFWRVAALLLITLLLWGSIGFAETGEKVVSLGADLDVGQRAEMLSYFGVEEDRVNIIEVTNQEEYQYLEGVAGREQIGTRAISSVYLELLPDGEGSKVRTHNITWVTPEMYTATLLTAGVEDVLVTAAAPFPVSGTAALTGVVKAFEEVTGESLSEENKRVAHEEIIILGELAEEADDTDQTTELLQRAKEEVLSNRPLDSEQIEEIIRRLAGEMEIQLSEEQVAQLTSFLEKFNELDIDVQELRRQIEHFAADPATRSFFAAALELLADFFMMIVEMLRQ